MIGTTVPWTQYQIQLCTRFCAVRRVQLQSEHQSHHAMNSMLGTGKSRISFSGRGAVAMRISEPPYNEFNVGYWKEGNFVQWEGCGRSANIGTTVSWIQRRVLERAGFVQWEGCGCSGKM